jgi:spore maturation protein CgeB
LKQAAQHYVFLGLSITSTWGNGHATTYRALIKELARRGHTITFLERDVPWYSSQREFTAVDYCDIKLYSSLEELRDSHRDLVLSADAVVVGSYVPEGIEVSRWVQSVAQGVRVFYDIDTPVTLAALAERKCEYLEPELIPGFDLYLSFTGGPTLDYIERELGSPCARPLYCSVDPALYYPESIEARWTCAYLGTYAADRQPSLEHLLFRVAESCPAQRFAVAGPQYPTDIQWPENVERIEHLPASEHRPFYNAQKFALNLTRRDMIRAGYSPSVRLFEAAACGVPIVTDQWPGLDTFFKPKREILPVTSAADLIACFELPEPERVRIAARARERVLRFHTSAVRAAEFDKYVLASITRLSRSNKKWSGSIRVPVAPALIEN